MRVCVCAVTKCFYASSFCYVHTHTHGDILEDVCVCVFVSCMCLMRRKSSLALLRCVCVYACVHVCVYACVYVCVYACVNGANLCIPRDCTDLRTKITLMIMYFVG